MSCHIHQQFELAPIINIRKPPQSPLFKHATKRLSRALKKVSYIGIVFGSGTMFSASFCYQCFWWVFSNKIQVIGYS